MRRDDPTTRIGSARRAALFAPVLLIAVLGGCIQPGLDEPVDETAVVTEARADALSLVPGDAAMAVVVPDLEALDADLQRLAQTTGYPVGSFSLVELVRGLLGGAPGMRADGSMMLVYPDAVSLIDDDRPEPLVFIAVDDYRAFVGAGDSAIDESQPGEVRFMDEVWYARPVEGYAVLSRDLEQLARFRPAGAEGTSLRSSLATLGDVMAADAGIMAVVNIAAFAPLLRPLIAEDTDRPFDLAHGEWIGPADLHAFLMFYEQAADAVLRDGESVVFGAEVAADGLVLDMAYNLRADSELARMVGVGGAAASLWDRLPAGPLVSAAAVDFSGIDRRAVADWLVAAVPEGGPLYELAAGSLEMLRQTERIAMATYRSEEPRTSVAVFEGEGSRSLPELVAGYVDRMAGLAIPLPPIMAEDDTMVTAEATWTVDWDDQGLTIDGAHVEQFAIDPHLPAAYLELAATSLPETGWQPHPEVGLVTARDDFGVLTMNDDGELLAEVLEGLSEGGRLSDVTDLSGMQAQALQRAPFLEAYIDMTAFYPWMVASGTWEPMAVFGHLAPHEVAGQIVIPAQSLAFIFGSP